MTEWLMSIVGVVAIGVLLDILLPSGEINKYIKGVFGIVVVFVIIIPLPKLIKGDFINFFDATQEIEIDEGYYSDSLKRRNEEREKATLTYLKTVYSIKSIDIDYADNDFNEITRVRVYATSGVDASGVRTKTAEFLKIKEDLIIIESG